VFIHVSLCVCTDFSCVYICLFVCFQTHVSSVCVKMYNCQIPTFHVRLRCLPFPLRLHVFVSVSLCLSVWLRVCLSAPVARLCFPSSARALCFSLTSYSCICPHSSPFLCTYKSVSVSVSVSVSICAMYVSRSSDRATVLSLFRTCALSSARALYLPHVRSILLALSVSPHSSLSLCTYIHIFIYICTYEYIYIYSYTHIHIHIYIRTASIVVISPSQCERVKVTAG